jgi:hypothetical protein
MNKDKTPPVNANTTERRNTRIWAMGPLKSLPYIFKKVGREGRRENSYRGSYLLVLFSLEP